MGRTVTPVWLLAATALLLAGWLVVWPRSPVRPHPIEPASTPVPASRGPDGAWLARRFPARSPRPAQPQGYLVAYVRSGIALRARPFGPVLERLTARTQFGSPQALSVVRARNDRWLAVTTSELGNGRLGWVDARAGGLSYARTRLELEVELSSRTLVVRSGTRVLRRASVGVGSAGSPTPTGRFAVTDKLSGGAYSPVYGCCILALSARQTSLPGGWRGGNRIAIHGGGPGAVSAGCVHASESDLRYLMRLVPLGTPVVIRS